jgi:hypothetical protein
MIRAFLKALYLRYPKTFQDFMVEDLIGRIPKDVREPSVAFLAKGKDVLTRYFLFQSYSIQRRAVADIANAERFHGMLVFMKFLLALMEGAQVREPMDSILTEEVKEDPLEKVKVFAEGMAAIKKK